MQRTTRLRLERGAADSAHGVLTTTDLTAAGLQKQAVARLVRDGHLARPARHVYVARRIEANWTRGCAELLAACGPDAVIARQAAAQLWRLDGFHDTEPIPHVNVAMQSSARGRTVHRVPQLEPCAVLDGLPVTGVAQTLIELGAELGTIRTLGNRALSAADRVELALECAVHRNVVDISTLQQLVDSLPARRAGLPVLVRVLARRPSGPPTESFLETRWAQEFRRAGFRDVRRQLEIFDATGRFIARVDLSCRWHRCARGRWVRASPRPSRVRTRSSALARPPGAWLRGGARAVARPRTGSARCAPASLAHVATALTVPHAPGPVGGPATKPRSGFVGDERSGVEEAADRERRADGAC